MKKVFRVLLIIIVILIVAVAGIVTYIKTALPDVGAAQNIKVEITPARLERGKYIANHVAVCVDCHSHRDWNFYAGPVAAGTFGGGGERFGKEIQFPGTIYSKNITPYGLHDWTDGEIFRAITTGVDKDGNALFPLMGYLGYGHMDTEDVYSVISYVRSLPSLKNDVPERALDFPVNILVNTMPAKATPSPKPDSNNSVEYGRYITAIANCVECHSKVDKGARIKGTEFGGGREFNFPNGTTVTSANITADNETGIGAWTKDIFIQKFKQYTDSSYHLQPVSKTDYNTIMPWLMYSGMTPHDLGAIYDYLRTVTPLKNKVEHFKKKA